MYLNEFLEMLSEVELSQNVFGSLNEDEKLEKKYELINVINRGLTDLATRFITRKGILYLDVDTYTGKTKYDITDPSLILTDYDDKELNIIKILEVWDSFGYRYHLNTINNYEGYYAVTDRQVQQLSKTKLQFDNNTCDNFKIVYHKGAKLIDKPDKYTLFQPQDVKLDIEIEFVNALIYFVASRIFSINPPMEGYAAPYSPAVTFSKKYEEECQRIAELNTEIEGTGNTSQRFNRGFP